MNESILALVEKALYDSHVGYHELHQLSVVLRHLADACKSGSSELVNKEHHRGHYTWNDEVEKLQHLRAAKRAAADLDCEKRT